VSGEAGSAARRCVGAKAQGGDTKEAGAQAAGRAAGSLAGKAGRPAASGSRREEQVARRRSRPLALARRRRSLQPALAWRREARPPVRDGEHEEEDRKIRRPPPTYAAC
jgi:type IV secretory pathway TrbL component